MRSRLYARIVQMIVPLLRAATILTCVTTGICIGIRPCLIEMFIWALGIEGSASGRDIYLDFKKKPNGIVVFNHPTPYDQAVMYKELDRSFCYVAKKERLGLLCAEARRYGALVMEPGYSTAAIIKQKIETRKPGDSLIAIAPAAGHASPYLVPLGTFHKGAFLPRTSVLPVVIHYAPFIYWRKGVHMIMFFWKTLCHTPIRYTLRVLPPMTQSETQTMEDFMAAVKVAMERALEEIESATLLQPPSTSPSSPLAYSSLLFAFTAVRAMYRGIIYPATGMAITAANTLWCHGKGGSNACFVDTIYNFTAGPIFTLYAVMQHNWLTVACAGIAVTSYMCKFHHFWCVHLPVFIGFLVYG
jgi:1-acyl-sn-glycerol-3-phosphate acyltransferase